MRIIFNIHLFPPKHCCGSEMMAYRIIKFLQARGHEVRVVLQQAKIHKIQTPYSWEGIDVHGPSANYDQFRWADVLCTHLDFTQFTIAIGMMLKKSVINFIHNDTKYSSIENAHKRNYVVYNSKWIADKLNYRWPSMIITPPCDVEDYNVCENPIENEYITLISLNENKGGNVLKKIAEAIPEKKFLGVMGSYDHQITDQPGNVKVVPNTPDILSIYKQTRTLLMPSRYESWGRTATEAMCNGIPVICCPTPGLLENCGDAGLYADKRGDLITNSSGEVIGNDCDTYDITSFIKQIKKLDRENFYNAVSERCRERAAELNSEKQLHELEQFIRAAAQPHLSLVQ